MAADHEGHNPESLSLDDAAHEPALKIISDGVSEQITKNEIRFGKIEAVYARLIGGLAFGAVILPLITGMLVYLLAKSQ